MAAKKEKTADVDLTTWAQEQASKLPEEIDGVKIYRANDLDSDGHARVTGFVELPGLDATQGFIAALVYVQDNLDPETDEVTTVDIDKKRFVVDRVIPNGEGKSATSYIYSTAYQLSDDLMSFVSYDVDIEFKEKGLIKRTLALEKFKPATNTRHKEIVEGFFLANSKIIDGITQYAKENSNLEVTHWPEVKKGKVTQGMNETEVKLIGGKPRSVTTSGSRIQWMYSNSFIVIFTDGTVSHVVQ
ncbi:MAG: hypothetical protein LIP02_11160 [Bacteroidales bacterium]|nr:hypothetical protein [Bacteroidales bacterium]